MTKQIKLPCGINKNGEIVYIENAKNGLACECVCPGCKQPLIAKNGGSKREAHFAHLNTVECEHGYQSALHYLAKDLFLEIQYLTFIKNGKVEQYKIDRVEIEQRLDTIIPDLIVICDGKPFIVEILVTHALDDEKKAKIKSMMISTIEIDLSRFHNELITKDALRQELCNPDNFRWIYDADEDLINYKKKIIQEYGTKFQIGIGNAVACPFLANQPDKFTRYVTLDFCLHCPNCVENLTNGFIHCRNYLPYIFVNERKVLFASEFQQYEKTFQKELEKAMQIQYQTFLNIGKKLYPPTSYITSPQRQKSSKTYYHHRYYKKH